MHYHGIRGIIQNIEQIGHLLQKGGQDLFLTQETGSLPLYENRQGAFACHRSPNLTFPPHLHADMEAVLVEYGEIFLREGEREFRLEAGDFALVFPGRLHSFESQGESCMLLALCPVEMAGDFRRTLLRCVPESPTLCRQKVHPDIGYAMAAMLEITEQNGNLAAAKAFVQLLLARALPEMDLAELSQTPSADLTARVVGWISENFTGPVSLDILSEALGAGKYRISRVFGEKLKTSLSDYVNQLRIDRARTLLLATDKEVSWVSAECGYENPRTFNREFRRICGCTPREYRKKFVLRGKEQAEGVKEYGAGKNHEPVFGGDLP